MVGRKRQKLHADLVQGLWRASVVARGAIATQKVCHEVRVATLLALGAGAFTQDGEALVKGGVPGAGPAVLLLLPKLYNGLVIVVLGTGRGGD